MIRVKVTPHGFSRVNRALENATSPALHDRLRHAVLGPLAREYVERVKQAIVAGQAQGPGLHPSTIARKGHGTPWLDKTDLLNAIEARPLGTVWHGGIPETAKNRRGQPLDLIALILEIGSLTIPARPVFGPVLTSMKGGKLEPAGVQADIEAILRQAFS